MIKNYKQYINEDIKSKNVSLDFTYDNIKQLWSQIKVKLINRNNDLKISISGGSLYLDDNFYKSLEKDGIKIKDIMFENCREIELFEISRFTKVSDYGAFGSGIINFNCCDCANLISLEGSPKEVDGDFSCAGCLNLTSLKFAPEKVGGKFDCMCCYSIKNLQGSPEIVHGYFCCAYCDRLTNLQGVPEVVDCDFICTDCENLTSLEFAPKRVGGNFDCRWCKNITSLEGAPETIGGTFYCRGCNDGFIKQAKTKYKDKVVAHERR